MSTGSLSSRRPVRLFLLSLAIPFCGGHSTALAQRYLTTLGIVADLPAGSGAHAIITGDYNGDGLTDIAVLGERQVSFQYQQDGAAGWKEGTLTVGKPIVAGASGRCNRDRLADLGLL